MNLSKLGYYNSLNSAKLLYFFFVFSLFFPIRYVFNTKFAYLTGIYSDFTSISLYLSDILLFITWVFIVLSRGRTFYHVVKSLKWLFFCLILAFFVNFDSNKGLNIFFFLKFLEFIVAYGTTLVLFQEFNLKKALFWFFCILISIQSLIALAQFFFQHSVGLFKLGEQQIFTWNLGIAKIITNGIVYIRGYGTFPHPNLLSAFLLTGIIMTIWLILNSCSKWHTIILSFLLILNIFGLTVTFSRATFLALFISFFVVLGFWMIHGKQRTFDKFNQLSVITALIFSFTTSFLIFQPYLLTRATISDQATAERGVYNKIGLKMIADKPIFGVGMGESVLHMQQYSYIKLWPWQIQPIHNYFLLAATELGIPGALILLWIFLSHLKFLWSRIRDQKLGVEIFYLLSLASVLFSFLILMMFDHYFYTLQQTQMLLWVALGLIAAEIKKHPA